MYYSLWDFLQEEITPEIKLLTRNLDFQTVPIESISVQELPVDDFIQKDELVLSTAIGCLEREDLFQQLVKEVSRARAAAMILTFKDPKFVVPSGVIAYANSVDLPLFVIPWQYRFSEIQTAVIKSVQEKKLKLYKELQSSLFDLFFESQSLESAADLIADSLKAWVAIVEKNGRLLAKSQNMAVPPEEAVRIAEKPIRIGTVLGGYLRLYGPKESAVWSAEEEKNLIEKLVCFPLSLWFNRKNIEDMVEIRLKNDFVWNLANKNYASLEEITAQGARLSFDLNRPYTCILLKAVPRAERTDHTYSVESAADTSVIEGLLIEIGRTERLKIMVADRSLEFIIYLENPAERAGAVVEAFLDAVDAQLTKLFPVYQFYWGISEITCKTPDFSQLYKDAALALGYCINSNQQRYRFTYRDTKDLQIISVLSGNPQILAIAADTIGALRKYDTSSGIDLMGTLIEYINCNYNISLTARNLHIHRQSLLYRLEKIEALTEMSLSNHKDLFLLEICTRILSGY